MYIYVCIFSHIYVYLNICVCVYLFIISSMRAGSLFRSLLCFQHLEQYLDPRRCPEILVKWMNKWTTTPTTPRVIVRIRWDYLCSAISTWRKWSIIAISPFLLFPHFLTPSATCQGPLFIILLLTNPMIWKIFLLNGWNNNLFFPHVMRHRHG